MRVLIVGDWHSQLHEQPVSEAFRKLGHQISCFKWHTYFSGLPGQTTTKNSILRRLQNKYLIGPCVERLNGDFLDQAESYKPDLVFIYRGTHIVPKTLRQLRMRLPRTAIAGYNNDDPFAPKQPAWLWRHFIACLPLYDVALAYRQHNLTDFRRHGAKRVYLLRSWFIPDQNYPEELSAEDMAKLGTDVTFIGHYENDGRTEYLEEIAKQGFRLKLFGPEAGWDKRLSSSPWLRDKIPVTPIRGSDYNKALCAAKIALCFFSRLNRDTYTRRCFEIPATGTLLMSEYSAELAEMFTEGLEAEFFRSKAELIEKIRFYLAHPERRNAVARAGLERVRRDGHDSVSRIRGLLHWLATEGILDTNA